MKLGNHRQRPQDAPRSQGAPLPPPEAHPEHLEVSGAPEGGSGVVRALRGCGQAYGRAQIHTPEFKRWFGASKVLGVDGEPMTVVHGTPYCFSEFRDRSGGGIWFGSKDDCEAEVAILDEGASSGLPVVPSPDPDLYPSFPVGARMIPVFLRIENPLESEDPYPDVEEMIKNGFDGAIWRDSEGEIITAMVVRPDQVKSSVGNCGAFDRLNPDIRS